MRLANAAVMRKLLNSIHGMLRHDQVAPYGWAVVPGATSRHRRRPTWEAAVYADTEESLEPDDEERWREDLAAAVFTRAGE